MKTMQEDLDDEQAGPVRRFTRVEYDRLVAAGWFEDERIELLDGVLFEMAPIDPAHSYAGDILRHLLARGIADRALIKSGTPFAASDVSEPQPDLFVVPMEPHWNDHPAHALLVVEVSRSSLRRDRGRKARIYSTALVDEYWIVNHIDRVVEIYRDPDSDGWRTVLVARPGERIAPLAFPDAFVDVSAIIPPA
jgi:Uma2 family endonuclease